MIDTAKISEKTKLLDDTILNQVKGVFGKLETPVTLKAVVDLNQSKSREMASLLLALSQLSSQVSLELYAPEEAALVPELNIRYLPATGLYKNGVYARAQFHGVPGGKELNSLVIGIYNVSGPGQELEKRLRTQIDKLNKKSNIKVCVSLSCHHCPSVVIASQRIAMLNPNIEAEMLDANLYPALVGQYKIERVPFIIVNDTKVYMGNKQIEDIIIMLK